MLLYSVSLTADEMLLLDGKVRSEIQKEVDKAKESKAMEDFTDDSAQAAFIADALREARTNGRLVFQFIPLRYCKYSGKFAGYATHKRNGRYHRKGEVNFGKPLAMAGVELANRFVRIEGQAILGCCVEFWNKVRPSLAAKLENVRAEIAEQIMGYPPKWKCFNRCLCQFCKWSGHEGQLLNITTIFGAQYPGKCPHCHASVIEKLEGFDIVSAEDNNATA